MYPIMCGHAGKPKNIKQYSKHSTPLTRTLALPSFIPSWPIHSYNDMESSITQQSRVCTTSTYQFAIQIVTTTSYQFAIQIVTTTSLLNGSVFKTQDINTLKHTNMHILLWGKMSCSKSLFSKLYIIKYVNGRIHECLYIYIDCNSLIPKR